MTAKRRPPFEDRIHKEPGRLLASQTIPDPVAAYLASIGRKGGKASSAKKIAAARRNGRKGGRPPRKAT